MGGQKRLIQHFPHFFQTEEPHSLFYKYMEVFGALLDIADRDLIKLMHSHWIDTADNEGSKGFDTNQKGDLDKILTLFIESLGGTSLLKQVNRRAGEAGKLDDATYRERMKRIIQVLLGGASNRDGIREIVAANLGIFGNSEAAIAALNQIEVIEYLPKSKVESFNNLQLFQTFVVKNPNPQDTPVMIYARTLKFLSSHFKLKDFTITNLTTGDAVQYPDIFQEGTELNIYPDGTATLIEGSDSSSATVIPIGSLPTLPPGVSIWQIQGESGQFAGSHLEQPNNRRFSTEEPPPLHLATFTPSFPVVNLKLTYTKFQPATFMVRIPWDIPGYSEVLDTLEDKPRHQIPFIVNKIKAAGVWAVVAYQKNLSETHEMSDQLNTELEDFSFPEQQPMQDQLLIGGVFGEGENYIARYNQSVFL